MATTTIYVLMFEYAMHFVRIIVLCALGYYATAFIRKRVYTYLSRIYPDELRSLIVARIIAYAFLFVIMTALLHEFGLNLTALLGTAGVIGLAIAYASQKSIANIISGLFLTIEHPFSIGDILVIDNVEGTVERMNLFAVMLRTQVGTIIRVPHEQLLKDIFTNVTALPMRSYDMKINIAVDEDIKQVLQIIKEVINNNQWCNKDLSEGFLKEISGNYLTIVIRMWAQQKYIPKIQKILPIEIKEAFDKSNIKLAMYRACHGQC